MLKISQMYIIYYIKSIELVDFIYICRDESEKIKEIAMWPSG